MEHLTPPTFHQPPTLDQVRDYQRKKLITVREHRDFPLLLCNYTDRANFRRVWDAVTLQCRGLVLHRDTGVVVARGFDKFFGIHESEAGEPPQELGLASVKFDGCLGLSFMYDGQQIWTTRGDFDSAQAAGARQLWLEKYPKVRPPEDCTVITEIIADETHQICFYDYEAHVVLGIREASGREWPFTTVQAWAAQKGLPCAVVVEGDVAQLQSRAREMDTTAEGFVIRWDTPRGVRRMKIKSRGYVQLDKLIGQWSERFGTDCWYYGRTDWFDALREQPIWQEITGLWGALDQEEAQVRQMTEALAVDAAGMLRAEMARVFKDHPNFSLLVRLLDGGEPDYRFFVYRQHYPTSRPRPLPVVS